MATQPTNLPVPSESYRDLKFNAGRIDEFVTSMGWTYTDRIGNKHYTIEGINHIVQEAMTSIGYVILAGQTFTTGATLNSPNEILLNEADNSYYKWTGTFASGGKEVPPDSTPESSGGIGPGKWLNVGDSSLRSDLATGGKATLIGYNAETVQAALTRHDTDFSRIVSLDERTTVPPNEYSGNKHWTPIFEEGHQLTNYVFKTPVHVDFQFSSDPLNVATGPLFTFGRDDLSGSAAFWSQDSYELRNAVIDGGTSEIAVFEPWTAHTATVENNRILSNGEPGKYAINFKAQNWWPIVRGNTFADYTDKGGNFCKAADDEGSATDKYSGNSRLTFTQNRCKWLGAGTGGVMLYSSGVAASITDNSSENSLIAIKLGYPSSYAVIDRLYNEMLAGGQNVIEIGDNIAAPVNNY
ncbi:hypothetical protein VBL27_23650, partial [Enterobacter cloacae]|nr:hypothetical protein [Enterobacter cloacae]